MTPLESITIFLPLPGPALLSNSRAHWRKKAKATKRARLHALTETRKALAGQDPPLWTAAQLDARFSMPHLRHDPANLMHALKAYQDGMADAGIVVNDRGIWPNRPEVVKDPAVIDHPNPFWRSGIVRLSLRPLDQFNPEAPE